MKADAGRRAHPTDPGAAIERYFSRAPDDSYFLHSTTISRPTAR
jgi:hypothetical protein